MKYFIFFFLIPICLSNLFLDIQVPPDCDEEFGKSAMNLLQSYISDLIRLEQINAILSSCNKAMLQKITEVSVFFMHKDGIQKKLFEDLQNLSRLSLEQKAKLMKQKTSQAPSNVQKIMEQMSNIYVNKSLSGNEKVAWVSASLLDVNPQDRKTVQRILNNNDVMTDSIPIKPINMIAVKENSTSEEEPSITSQEIRPHIPPSFLIKKDSEPADNHFLAIRKKFPKNTSELPSRKDSPIYGELSQIPPTLYSKSDPGANYIDLMTKNAKPQPEETSHVGNFGTPIQPIVHTQGRPRTIVENELLNARNMLWRDAVNFLDQQNGIPDVLKRLLKTGLESNGESTENSSSNDPTSNTFTSSLEAYEQFRKMRDNTFELNDNARIPATNDATRPIIVPVTASQSLDRFDTQTGRFDKVGPTNRIVLSASPAEHIPALPMSGMETNEARQTNDHLLPTTTAPHTKDELKTYPDYREGLFPLHENHAKLETASAKTIQSKIGNEVHKDINDQVNGKGKGIIITDPAQYANGGTVSIENYPGPPYVLQPKTQQTIGDDLSESDPVGSIPMGRFNKEFPHYPPAPTVVLPTTTVISIIKKPQQPDIHHVDNRFPYFPNIDTPIDTLPEFRPYRGPEEITGSHLMLRELFNIRHHGNNRFVKVDLLNE